MGLSRNGNAAHPPAGAVIAATALSGAAALVYEVIASRVLSLYAGGSLAAVTVVLMTFLGGLAIGAGLMAELQRRRRMGRDAFVAIQIGIALYAAWVLVQFGALPSLFDVLGTVFPSRLATLFVGGTLFLIIPTVLLGATFPLAQSLLVARRAGSDVSRLLGWLYTFDVVGAVLGTAVAGFWLVPQYGLVVSLLVAAGLNLCASAVLLPWRPKPLVQWLVVVVAVILGTWLLLSRAEPFSTVVDPETGTVRRITFDDDTILEQRGSPYGVITVREEELPDGGVNRVLSIEERDQCLSADHRSELAIADAALTGLPSGQRVLHIGLGCGFTLQRILTHDPASVRVVEINPVMPEMTRMWFTSLNGNALGDARVSLTVADGADVLRTDETSYDVIIIDIEEPSVAHASPLYTSDLFAIAHERLVSAGRLALWGYSSRNPRYLPTLVRTIESAFPVASYVQDGSYLIVAADSPVDLSALDLYHTAETLQEQVAAYPDVAMHTIAHPVLEGFYDP